MRDERRFLRRFHAGLAFASAAAFAAGALAQAVPQPGDFRSIGEQAVVMYDGPSTRAKRLFVASRGLPVEVISTDGTWVKVRDAAGDLVWVERRLLSERRTVIVTVPAAEVRQRPDEQSPVLFQAAGGVAFDYVEQAGSAPGWVRVRHRDGQVGFVRLREVWGA